jgi:hypothetical protein
MPCPIKSATNCAPLEGSAISSFQHIGTSFRVSYQEGYTPLSTVDYSPTAWPIPRHCCLLTRARPLGLHDRNHGGEGTFR